MICSSWVSSTQTSPTFIRNNTYSSIWESAKLSCLIVANLMFSVRWRLLSYGNSGEVLMQTDIIFAQQLPDTTGRIFLHSLEKRKIFLPIESTLRRISWRVRSTASMYCPWHMKASSQIIFSVCRMSTSTAVSMSILHVAVTSSSRGILKV